MTTHAAAETALLRRLAAAAMGRALHADVQAEDYDWSVPCHYRAEELRKADRLAAALAGRMGEWLAGHLRQAITLRPAALVQHFGERLAESLASAREYRLPLGVGEGTCGLLALDRTVAAGWVARLLGGARGDEQTELSSLEADLLGDLAGALAGIVAAEFEQRRCAGLQATGEVSTRPVELPAEVGLEYAELAFGLGEGAEGPVLRLVLPCELIDRMVAPAAEGVLAGEEARQALLARLGQMPVQATAVAAAAELKLRDVLSVEAGDVLLLPARPSEAMGLYVKGKAVAEGFPVVAGGRVALRITRSHAEGT